MSTKRVCDMSCGAMHEFALVLDKAGFNADIVYGVVNSKGNKQAEAMLAALPNGTPTKDLVKSSASNDYFELIYESAYITVPDMDAVHTYSQEKWSKEMAGVTPSTTFVAGTRRKVKVFRFKKSVSSQRCVDFVNSQNASLPNVFGLAIAEMTVGSELPKDRWILGFDNRDKLSVGPRGHRRVPHLCRGSDGRVHRDWYYWDVDWNAERCLVLLCD